MSERRIPIFTDLTITPKASHSLKRYLNSIKRNLPDGWNVCKDREYEDKDTFWLLSEVICLQTHSFIDKRSKKALSAFIYLGLTDESIVLLRIEFKGRVAKKKLFETIGYVVNALNILVLKKNKHYTNFTHDFKFGGPYDENFIKNDRRDARSYKMFSKEEKRIYFLSRTSNGSRFGHEYSFHPPNNISLSLSLMKKAFIEAGHMLSKLDAKMGSETTVPKMHVPLLYDYFESIQTCVIFGYIAIESFANAVIPENYKYERVNERGIKETWNKENIERWMSTSEKVSSILPLILNTSDIKQERFWSNFKELESLRNEITHQKTVDSGTRLDSKIYAEMLDDNIATKISSALKVIEFFYKRDNAHPYFPLGLGIAKFQILEIESMEKYFRHLTDEEIRQRSVLPQ